MLLAERLVEGVDVWINTPRRPWEASGTSGMKVLVNGGLNLSVLDGWWAEAFAANSGWAIGDGVEHGDDPAWDHADAEALYAVLEQQIIPEFYARDENGIPTAWVEPHLREYGDIDPGFFRESRGPAVHGRALHSGRERVRGARGQGWNGRRESALLAAKDSRAVGRRSLRSAEDAVPPG